MKDNHFETVTDPQLIHGWDGYLRAQVELFVDAELDLLLQHGLTKTATLLDAGCGAGAWCKAVRRRLPSIRILAVDSNTQLIEEFRSDLQRSPDDAIMVKHWDIGRTDTAPDLRDCNAAVVRYVLQHLQEPSLFLKALRRCLPSGTPVFIIEEDDALFSMDPELRALRRMFRIHSEWAREFNSVADMGRKCAAVARRAGLSVDHVRIIGQTSLEAGVAAFVEYYKWSLDLIHSSAPRVLDAAEKATLRRGLDALIDLPSAECVIFHPQVVTITHVP